MFISSKIVRHDSYHIDISIIAVCLQTVASKNLQAIMIFVAKFLTFLTLFLLMFALSLSPFTSRFQIIIIDIVLDLYIFSISTSGILSLADLNLAWPNFRVLFIIVNPPSYNSFQQLNSFFFHSRTFLSVVIGLC